MTKYRNLGEWFVEIYRNLKLINYKFASMELENSGIRNQECIIKINIKYTIISKNTEEENRLT